MSNYINVLRRLERDRRAPESAPMPDHGGTEPERPAATAPVSEPLPVAAPNIEMPTAIAPAAAPRTVIPLPSLAPTPVATPPVPPAPVRTTPYPGPDAAPATRPAESRSHDTRRSRAFATEAHPGIATLLDNIRLIANGRESRTVVLCGASNAEAVLSLAGALASHAEQTGMRAFLATLHRTAQGAVVIPARGATSDALAIDLDAGSSPEVLSAWVERIAPGSDLIVVTGPPLATSIDAALLACASDGLVIVAESEVTERAALQLAAERARIAGCKTLGVVMHGTKDRMPAWLRRLLGDRLESHAPRED